MIKLIKPVNRSRKNNISSLLKFSLKNNLSPRFRKSQEIFVNVCYATTDCGHMRSEIHPAMLKYLVKYPDFNAINSLANISWTSNYNAVTRAFSEIRLTTHNMSHMLDTISSQVWPNINNLWQQSDRFMLIKPENFYR